MLGGNLDICIHDRIFFRLQKLRRMGWARDVPRLRKSRSENTVLLGKN